MELQTEQNVKPTFANAKLAACRFFQTLHNLLSGTCGESLFARENTSHIQQLGQVAMLRHRRSERRLARNVYGEHCQHR